LGKIKSGVFQGKGLAATQASPSLPKLPLNKANNLWFKLKCERIHVRKDNSAISQQNPYRGWQMNY
jgi:hypothetical protein